MTSSTVTKSPKSESETKKSESGVLLSTFKTSRDKDDFKNNSGSSRFCRFFKDTKSSGTVRLQVFLKNGKITQQFLSWRYNILLLLLYTDRSLILGR